MQTTNDEELISEQQDEIRVTKDDIQQLIESNELDKAEEQIGLFIQEHPDDINAKLILGRILAKQNKHDDAIAVFIEVLQHEDSQNFEALFYLAFSYERLEQFDKASDTYYKALGLGYNSLVHYRIGLLHTNYKYERRRIDEARRHLQYATGGEHPIENAFIQLAAIEQTKRAIYVLQNGLKLFPQSMGLYHRLANYYLYGLGDYSGCIDTVVSAKQQEIDTDELRFLSALAHFRLRQFGSACEIIASITTEDEEFYQALKCLQAATFVEESKYDIAESILQDLITKDFRNRLQFAAHTLLICCYLKQGKTQQAELIFDEIPEGEEFSDLSVTTYPFGDYELDEYLMEALEGLVSQGSNEKSITKARGMRSIYCLNQHARKPEESIDWQALKEDLSAALKVSPHNVSYNTNLGHVLEELQDWISAARHYILAQVNTDKELYYRLNLLDKIYESKAKFNRLLKEIEKIISADEYLWKNRFAKFFLEEIIEFLFSQKDYVSIIQLAQKFEYPLLLKADVLFEIAYAYVETNDKKRGASFYRAYLRDKGANPPICNNLGLLCEDDGNLEEGEKLFHQALELDADNEKAKRNLLRVQQKIRQAEEQKQAFEKAARLYLQENVTVRRTIAKLYEERGEDDLILCNLDRLAVFLKVHSSEADEWVEEFVRKKYFEEVKNQSLAYHGRILQVNPGLISQLQKELDTAREEEFVEQLAVEMTSENLNQKYGYNQILTNQLSLLSSLELAAMLERDLREAVTALATQSYKSVLVLCGSIIEAILMDRLIARKDSAIKSLERILTKEGRKISSKDKHIDQWPLNSLLDVAREENLISSNLYHWGHGIRGFRNLVHPAVEQRREMDVSRENAEVAWHVVKRLLKELTDTSK